MNNRILALIAMAAIGAVVSIGSADTIINAFVQQFGATPHTVITPPGEVRNVQIDWQFSDDFNVIEACDLIFDQILPNNTLIICKLSGHDGNSTDGVITDGVPGPIVGFGQTTANGVDQRYIVPVRCDPNSGNRPQNVTGNFDPGIPCDVQDIDDVKVIVVGKTTTIVTVRTNTTTTLPVTFNVIRLDDNAGAGNPAARASGNDVNIAYDVDGQIVRLATVINGEGLVGPITINGPTTDANHPDLDLASLDVVFVADFGSASQAAFFVTCESAADEESCSDPSMLSNPELETFANDNCNDGIDNDGDRQSDSNDLGCIDIGSASDEIGISQFEDITGTSNVHIDNDGAGNNFIVFQGNVDEGNPEIFFSASIAGGPFTLENLSNSAGDSVNPRIIATATNPILASWEEGDDVVARIGNVGLDGIVTFGDIINVSESPEVSSFDHRIASSGNDFFVTWTEGSSVAFRAIRDGGASLDDIIILGTGENPDIDASGDTVGVVWQRDGEIFIRSSLDGGINFAAEENLSNNEGDSHEARIHRDPETGNWYVPWLDNTASAENPNGFYVILGRSSLDLINFEDTVIVNLTDEGLVPQDDVLQLLEAQEYAVFADYTYSSRWGGIDEY